MSQEKIKTIGVLCSGGDSPGMNCAIRAVTRTAIGSGIKVYGIYHGYAGLLEGNMEELDRSSVGNIMHHGGTMLKTSRCPEFHNPDTRREAANILRRKKIDALVVIGGNGSYAGALALHQEHGINVATIPGTIDNDVIGTEYSIGFDTAVQTAIDAVDKIRDTASSHARTFIVEVMGRKSPAIALHVGICSGAENIVIPSQEVDYEQIANDINRGIQRGKTSSIIIAAEGETPGLCYRIQEGLKEKFQIDAHVCILGHIQRGGKPSATDRFIASSMGNTAVKSLIEGNQAMATCFLDGAVKLVNLSECQGKKDDYHPDYLELARTLSI